MFTQRPFFYKLVYIFFTPFFGHVDYARPVYMHLRFLSSSGAQTFGLHCLNSTAQFVWNGVCFESFPAAWLSPLGLTKLLLSRGWFI